ncbi:hypothetical protein J3R30DRAFT_2265627 [Lentinula aciculospora]|uniref:RlpA-like protein double-psi beta-barrel domain-containing protein n=1 Tax=Lentinula aciculospora TaxID=153920 RepID=A0A9W8ZVA9_9AGAR|nr:hypothetical protein J3R30DRAFT_2265627 [Lentinula aciculospora]
MPRPIAIFIVYLFFMSFTSYFPGVASSILRLPDSSPTQSRDFRRAHSLGDSYNFDPRDGWTTLNATYIPQNGSSTLQSRSNEVKSKSGNEKFAVSGIANSLKALSEFVGVTITWYTGHDLLNPSCWANSGWSPTDESFVCALTLDGWETKPKCFDFLELCNKDKKCVYVRVVDSCAGCAVGSKHVDLTQAAFKQLASLDEGTLTIQMRLTAAPRKALWIYDIWGPWV